MKETEQGKGVMMDKFPNLFRDGNMCIKHSMMRFLGVKTLKDVPLNVVILRAPLGSSHWANYNTGTPPNPTKNVFSPKTKWKCLGVKTQQTYNPTNKCNKLKI
eukprot:1670489-Amphidinium_carterae.1